MSAPHCCATALPDGWLVWTYKALRGSGPWYEDDEDALLYETLSICLDVDILVSQPPKGAQQLRYNVLGLGEDQTAENYWTRTKFEDVWTEVQGPGLHLRVPSIPPGQSVFARGLNAPGARHVILGVVGEWKSRLCDGCLDQVHKFIVAPESNGFRGAEKPPVEQPWDHSPGTWITLRKRDAISTLLTLATQDFFTFVYEGARTALPKQYVEEMKFTVEHLRQHHFGVTVVFNQKFVLSGQEGFGYFLTEQQEAQITERLSLSKGGALFARASWFLQGFTYAAGEDQQGLVATVTKRRQPMWAKDLRASAIYALEGRELFSRAELRRELAKALSGEEATRVTASLEQVVVHQPTLDREKNFILEVPFYAQVEGPQTQPRYEAIAALFFVLPSRPSASVMSLLALCGRSAFRTAVQAAACGIAPATEISKLDRARWSPLLARGEPLVSDFLDTAFPRVPSAPFHDMEEIFKATPIELYNAIKGVPGRDTLIAHHDTQLLVRLIERSQPRMTQWAYYLLKMRVRSKQEGLQNDIYVLDLLHYLMGWSGDSTPNGRFKDLWAILGRPRDQSIRPFAESTETILSISGFAGATREWDVPQVVARRPKKTPTKEPESWPPMEWRCLVARGRDDPATVANPWELPTDMWSDHVDGRENGHGNPLYWLKKARVRVPNYQRTGDPAGSLGVFLGRIVERVAEEKPDWLHLCVRHDIRRLVVEALWRAPKTPSLPRYLLPEDQRIEGGDMGWVTRTQEVPQGWDQDKAECVPVKISGWYVALPLKYEGGTDSAFLKPQ